MRGKQKNKRKVSRKNEGNKDLSCLRIKKFQKDVEEVLFQAKKLKIN